ncbi:lytic transglycosylase domain-containing protein [Skermanella sp. TT6]|uniref:Lytic transglycosylase domain-containing protein n=1 Tax=Skermanella cutis TaxID=2775420 RepID=A0ABX7B287_9PROT|nr:lytic transglycosylase domain-containing protein [Skermanella sp. TT6]QQP88430.1 lytic transglycosylase domain-containing protein [Skermanella sp. TT6]
MAVDQRLPPVPGKKPSVPGAAWQPPVPARKPGGEGFAAAVERAGVPLPGRKPADVPPASVAGGPVVDAIRSVAGLSGHSFASLLSQAQQESGLDPKARNRKSSATGPFQFIERTWLDLVRRHGSAFGLGEVAKQIKVVDGAPTVGDAAARRKILALREDPNLSAGMAARYLGEGKERLGKLLGRPASTIESRIAYIMGPNGAARLINAAEKTPGKLARDLLPSAAAANRNLFHDRSGHALTASDMLNRLTRRMQADEKRFAALEDAPDPQSAPAHSNALLFAQMQQEGWPGEPEDEAEESDPPVPVRRQG